MPRGRLHHAREQQFKSFDEKCIPEPNSGCWLWTGAMFIHGYARFRGEYAHRFAYRMLVGPVPDGLELDHLCRVPSCVNPQHLEPVTHAINMKRSPLVGVYRRGWTHCPKGHPFSGENLGFQSKGARMCRECARQYQREWQRRQRSRHA